MISRVAAFAVGGTTGWSLFVKIVTIFFVGTAIVRLSPVWRPRGGRRSSHRSSSLGLKVTALVAAVIVATGGCTYAMTRAHAHTSTRASAASEVSNSGTDHYFGVFEPSEVGSYTHVEEFGTAVGRQPNIVLYYSSLRTPFQTAFADAAYKHGAIPFVQVNPGNASMKEVAAGRYDGELRIFARQIRAYGHPVVIGFAAEPNGNWYRWGWGHTPASEWIAAWRHVVSLFRHVGASNITWLWTVNSINASKAELRQWWPGSSYVTWVGIDGYYYKPTDTFSSVFGTTVQEIRTFTKAPILLSETAAGPSPKQPAQINGLFAGVRSDHLRGLVWFDMGQHDGAYHLDWRIEDSPAGLAAFRKALKEGSV
jgi:hypothetical protein